MMAAAIETVPLTDSSQLDDQSSRLSFSMAALEFLTPWKTSSAVIVSQETTSDTIITLEEVSQHDHSNDCWIILYDRVYDVTTFLKQHPGGADILLEYAGRDATLAFRGIGHTAQTIEHLRDFYMGQLPLSECIYRKKGGLALKGMPD